MQFDLAEVYEQGLFCATVISCLICIQNIFSRNVRFEREMNENECYEHYREIILDDKWLLIKCLALSLYPKHLPPPTAILICNTGHFNTICCFLQMRNGLLNFFPEKENKFGRQQMFYNRTKQIYLYNMLFSYHTHL